MGSLVDSVRRNYSGYRLWLRAAGAKCSRWLSGATYLQKWLILGVVIGASAGLGAIVFYEALVAATHFFLGVLAGYQVPTPTGEGGHAASASFTRPWALPLVVGLGALLGAVLVYRVAPEAEGHGTDAAISAIHHNPRGIRFRAVLVKIAASALTIGSGGSGGREGPTGQISAGMGSLLARGLDLSPGDARIAVATGVGSGIGSIFGAPLGGAILSTEILYRDDFDVEALLPSFIASIVGYVIFASVVGFKPLFGFNGAYHFTDPVHLLWFALIGILGGLFGLLYAKGFYGIADAFERVQLPRWSKPALGGLLVGGIALIIPEVLGTGYGWIQAGLGPRLLSLPLWIVLLLPAARILATGLSIGSGGSGGIFGPGMVIGAFIGASVWRLFEPIAPSMGHNPVPYVVVGMMCCFGSISRAPLAVMVMVSEMTGNISILAPAMIAVGLAWFIVRRNDDTIYRSQLKNRGDAPAQRIFTGMPLLANLPVRYSMAVPKLVLDDVSNAGRATDAMITVGARGAPVVDAQGRFEGTVSLADLEQLEPTELANVSDYLDRSAPSIAVSHQLDAALDALMDASSRWVPVLDDDRHVVGTLSLSDLVRGYQSGLLTSLRRVSDIGEVAGTFELEIHAGSRLADKSVEQANLPVGTVITSIQRAGRLVVPSGTTVLRSGDQLMLISRPDDAESVRDAGS
ncbi:MAG TPA: chloride channel protein [Acidimicrobiales bacterium]|nr:chloride channel protein [Acidimicrobiales bacterium]